MLRGGQWEVWAKRNLPTLTTHFPLRAGSGCLVGSKEGAYTSCSQLFLGSCWRPDTSQGTGGPHAVKAQHWSGVVSAQNAEAALPPLCQLDAFLPSFRLRLSPGGKDLTDGVPLTLADPPKAYCPMTNLLVSTHHGAEQFLPTEHAQDRQPVNKGFQKSQMW